MSRAKNQAATKAEAHRISAAQVKKLEREKAARQAHADRLMLEKRVENVVAKVKKRSEISKRAQKILDSKKKASQQIKKRLKKAR